MFADLPECHAGIISSDVAVPMQRSWQRERDRITCWRQAAPSRSREPTTAEVDFAQGPPRRA